MISFIYSCIPKKDPNFTNMNDTTGTTDGFKYTSIESSSPEGFDENIKYTRVEETN